MKLKTYVLAPVSAFALAYSMQTAHASPGIARPTPCSEAEALLYEECPEAPAATPTAPRARPDMVTARTLAAPATKAAQGCSEAEALLDETCDARAEAPQGAAAERFAAGQFSCWLCMIFIGGQ